jgi:hypothetical protein
MMKNNNKEKNMIIKRTNRKELSKIADFLKSIDCLKSDEEYVTEKEIQKNIENSKKAKGK